MPAVRRPRVDVVLRVPRKTVYSVEKARKIEVSKTTAIAGSSGLFPAANAMASTIPEVPVGSSSLSNTQSSTDKKKEEEEDSHLPMASYSETSSAEWNSLLIWARRMRGPQWDSGLGMWMVDRGGEEYHTFCSDPTQAIHKPSAKAAATADTSSSSLAPTGTAGNTTGAAAAAAAAATMTASSLPRYLTSSSSNSSMASGSMQGEDVKMEMNATSRPPTGMMSETGEEMYGGGVGGSRGERYGNRNLQREEIFGAGSMRGHGV